MILTSEASSTPVGSLLLAPAVAPWETTLDGVMGGRGNNPSIRLVRYDQDTGKVLNIHQYYLNLRAANEKGTDDWELEYNFTEYYGIPDMEPATMHTLAEQMWSNDDVFDKYYRANGVQYDPDEVWDKAARVVHYCSMVHLSYADYEACYEDLSEVSSAVSQSHSYLVFCVTVLCCLLLTKQALWNWQGVYIAVLLIPVLSLFESK